MNLKNLKTVVLAFAAMFAASAANAAITVTGLGTCTASTAATSCTVTTSGSFAAGDIGIVAVGIQASSTTIVASVNDGTGSGYTCTTGFVSGATVDSAQICYKVYGASASPASIVVTFNASRIAAVQIADITGLNAFDSNQGSATSCSSSCNIGAISPAPAVSPSAQPGALIGIAVANGTTTAYFTEDAAYTRFGALQVNTNLTLDVAYKLSSSTSSQTYAPSITVAGKSWGANAYSFINFVSLNTCKHGMLLLGAGSSC